MGLGTPLARLWSAARTRVASAAAAALAGNTRMTYASQWNRFCAWCDRQGVSSHSGRRGLASELGRALKTEFVLQYMSEEGTDQIRAEIHAKC